MMWCGVSPPDKKAASSAVVSSIDIACFSEESLIAGTDDSVTRVAVSAIFSDRAPLGTLSLSEFTIGINPSLCKNKCFPLGRVT